MSNDRKSEIVLQLDKRLSGLMPGAALELQTVAGIELFLLNHDYPQHELTYEQMMAVMNYPAYWAFCWASGVVLAEYMFNHRASLEGKVVLDFGSGSGVAAIAAAKAGAARVLACDIDQDALLATELNALQNNVKLELFEDYENIDTAVDVIIVADVLYDKQNLPWLDRFLDRAETVWVADSRIKNFSHPYYHQVFSSEASTLPDLDESDEFRHVTVYASHSSYSNHSG